MKSIVTVIGTFLFSIFVEGFVRLIVIFYHQEEFVFFGTASLPGISWVFIILVSVLVTGWLSGMLAITITGFSPVKHLLSLGVLFLLWRINEIFQMLDTEPIWYLIGITFSSLLGLFLAYLTHHFSNAQKTNH